MGRPKTDKGATRTTIYIFNKDIVQEHMFYLKIKDFKEYINNLIREDILKNGNEEIVKKYFDKEK